MNTKFQQLKDLGAGEFEHLEGSLIDHLNGTKKLLKTWSAPQVLQDAGLYHAAYGTAGFDESLTSTNNRQEIAKIIGQEAEAIVYQYCACDRDYVWPQIRIKKKVEFKDRFTGKYHPLSEQELCTFFELTVANELEIAKDNPKFINSSGYFLIELFTRMQPHISDLAIQAYKEILEA